MESPSDKCEGFDNSLRRIKQLKHHISKLSQRLDWSQAPTHQRWKSLPLDSSQMWGPGITNIKVVFWIAFSPTPHWKHHNILWLKEQILTSPSRPKSHLLGKCDQEFYLTLSAWCHGSNKYFRCFDVWKVSHSAFFLDGKLSVIHDLVNIDNRLEPRQKS